MNENKYKIIGENYISVCAWCFPGKSILTVCPELSPTVQISHGVCPACAAAFRAEFLPQSKTAGGKYKTPGGAV